MAAAKGLNKNRGLGALIPQKRAGAKAETKPDAKAEAKQSAKAETNPEPKPTGAKNKVKTKGADPTKANKSEKTTKSPTTSAKRSPAAGKTEKPAAKRADALTGQPEPAAKDGILEVKITEIIPNHEQPRKRFDDAGLAELADSIRAHGVITPLLVQKKDEYYELIAGERRWRAAGKAGLKKVPVIVREFSGQEAAEIALIENIQREDLNAMEEARAYKRLMEEYGLSQEEVAGRVSRARTTITNALRLLKLAEPVQQMLEEGSLTMGHARALLSLEDGGMQLAIAEQVISGQLSVRETEKLIRRMSSGTRRSAKKKEDPQLEAIYRDLEDQLRRSVGTRVSIRPLRGNKGRVEIDYYSNEDLERIIARLR